MFIRIAQWDILVTDFRDWRLMAEEDRSKFLLS